MSYSCEKCSKSFARKDTMTRHAKRCSSQSIYQCQVEGCGKIFSQSSQLRAHDNVHTKKKPYACGIDDCPARFGDPSSKARHVKEIHRTTHVNVCPVAGCSTRIKRNSAYNAHLKRKHGITDVKAYLRSRQPVLQSAAGPSTSNHNTTTSLNSAYAFNDEGDFAMPFLWPLSTPQMLAAPQVEPNDISIYGRTQLLEAVPEVPHVIDPALLQWDNDAFTFFRANDSSCFPLNTSHDARTLNYDYGKFRDDLCSTYDTYNPTMGSTVYPPLISSNSWHYSYH